MSKTQPSKMQLSKEKHAQLKSKGQLKGKPIRYPVSVETRYVADLLRLTKQMIQQTQREMKTILSVYSADESLQEKADRLKKDADEKAKAAVIAKAEYQREKLSQRFDAMFARKARDVANSMVIDVDKASVAHLTGTLRELSGSMTLKMDFMSHPVGKAIKESIAENVKLIRSIPDQYMTRIGKVLQQSAERGGDMSKLDGLFDKMIEQGEITERRAKNIALDQTRKAFKSINVERMKEVGVEKFEWVHSGGGANSREFHMTPFPSGLNGGIFEVNNPPVIDDETGETGLPADLPNCKCVMAPVITLEDFEGSEEESDE